MNIKYPLKESEAIKNSKALTEFSIISIQDKQHQKY